MTFTARLRADIAAANAELGPEALCRLAGVERTTLWRFLRGHYPSAANLDRLVAFRESRRPPFLIRRVDTTQRCFGKVGLL